MSVPRWASASTDERRAFNREWMARRRLDPEYRAKERERQRQRALFMRMHAATDDDLNGLIEDLSRSLSVALAERRRRAA